MWVNKVFKSNSDIFMQYYSTKLILDNRGAAVLSIRETWTTLLSSLTTSVILSCNQISVQWYWDFIDDILL